jgi:hypothetical protein
MYLNGLCEGGKANLGTSNPGLSNVKNSVEVGHECIPQGPPLDVLSPPDATNAYGRIFIGWTEVEARSDGEALSIEVEGNVREICFAREIVESIAFMFRTRDQAIQGSNLVDFTDDKVSSLWKNVSQVA